MPKRRNPKTGYFTKAGKSYDYLLEYSCVKEWTVGYSPNTVKNYLQALEKFCKWTYSNPDDLLKLNPEETKEKVLRFAKEYAGAGKHGKAVSVFNGLKSFFGYHNKRLDFNKYRRQFIKTIKKKVDYELIPDNELVYRMVDTCRRPIDRTIILFLFQSGIRVNALHRLNYSHVREQLERNSVPIRLKITNNIDTKLRHASISYYYTFIGKEAIDALRTYLEELRNKGVQLKDDDPLFRSKYGKRLAMKSIYPIIKNAAGRLGIDKRKVWPHLFRKSFRKVLNKSDSDEDTREALMGHKLPGSRGNYFDFHDIDEIEQKYMSCNFSREPEASAMRTFAEQLRKKEQDIEELKETVAKMQPMIEFMNSFDAPKNLKIILDFLKDDFIRQASDEKLRSRRVEFSSYVSDKLDEIVKRKGITRKEALEQLMKTDSEIMKEAEERFKKLENRVKKDSKNKEA